MTTEPSHRVHRLLKDYARQRQDQAGLGTSLDSGTRARLQAEVARAFGPDGPIPAPRSYASAIPSLWPRLLWGGAAAALVIGIATVFLRNDSERQRQLAQADKLQFFPTGAGTLSVPGGPPSVAEKVRSFQLGNGPATAPSAAAAPVPAKPATLRPPPAPAPELGQPNLALAMPRSERELDDMASNAPRFAAGLTPSRDAATVALDAKALPDLADAPRVASALATAASPPLAAAPAASQNNLVFQQDRSKYRQNRNSPPLPDVLTRFEVQPDGANVRIVDADGSVYAGAAAPVVNQSQPFSFRAAGTNRSLNQLVVFTGEYEPSVNTSLANQLADNQASNSALAPATATSTRLKVSQEAGRSRQQQSAPASAANNLSQQGRIQGHATIGGNQLNIEAQQVSP